MQSIPKIDGYYSRIITERGKGEEVELTPLQARYLAELRSFPSNRKAFFIEKTKHAKDDSYQVRAAGCAGVVNLDTLQLLVRPRLSTESAETNELLLKLMAFAYDWPELKFADSSNLGSKTDLFDWIVRVFHLEVKKVLQKGLWRKFRTFPTESRFIRGRLNIEKQIVLNLRRPAIFSCNPTEHTAAVPENLLLQSALSFAGKYCQSMVLRSQSKALAREFESATQTVDPQVEAEQIVLDRLNAYYRPAITLALLVLAKVGPTHSGGELQFFSFLIDMWALFERFMARWLKGHFSGMVAQPPMGLKVTSEGTPLSATVKPDGVIYVNGEAQLVVDTKYSSFPVRGRFGQKTVNMSHIYQMATYCTCFQCDGALIYPSEPESTTSLQTIHLPSNYRVFLRKVPWDRLIDENGIEGKELEDWFAELVVGNEMFAMQS